MSDNLEHGWVATNNVDEGEKMYTCESCGAPIYYGDYYYDFNGDKFCEDCIKDCRKTAK